MFSGSDLVCANLVAGHCRLQNACLVRDEKMPICTTRQGGLALLPRA